MFEVKFIQIDNEASFCYFTKGQKHNQLLLQAHKALEFSRNTKDENVDNFVQLIRVHWKQIPTEEILVQMYICRDAWN